MARRKAGGWTEDAREQQLDSFFGGMRDFVQERTGLQTSIGTEAEGLLVGLPLPALCLQYAFQSTVFPLSRVVQITGEEGSCKSALLYELMRWHMTYGGGAFLAQNELKDSWDMRAAIMRWRPDWLKRCEVTDTHSLEEWQKVWSFGSQFAKGEMDKPGGPGRTVPILVGCDSITATAPQDEIDQIMKEGCAKRGYALMANLISRFMRTIPQQIQGYPLTYVGTNHLKPSTDYMGRPTSTVPGGKSVKFYETFEIEMHKHQICDIDKLEYQGLRVVLKIRKNSLGPSRKQFVAEFLWWPEAGPDGQVRQAMAWDWDTATIDLLLRFETDKGKKTLYKSLQDICDINVVSKGDKTCWSRVLDIPRDNPQPYRVAGAMLEQREDVKRQMYPLLGIIPRRPFQPGIDYRVLLASAAENAQEDARRLYSSPETLPIIRGDESGDCEVPLESAVSADPVEPELAGAEA
jgi:hypothetical protein